MERRMSMTENELRINGKSFDETISLLEEFMESDDVHGELFTVLRSARDFMENLNEEIQQYRAIGTVEELQVLNRIAEETAEYVKEDKKILEAYKRIGTIDEFKALKEEVELYRNLDKTNFSDGYNKAIDEFCKEIVAEYDNDGCPCVSDYEDYKISIRDLFKIAEQLKGSAE